MEPAPSQDRRHPQSSWEAAKVPRQRQGTLIQESYRRQVDELDELSVDDKQTTKRPPMNSCDDQLRSKLGEHGCIQRSS